MKFLDYAGAQRLWNAMLSRLSGVETSNYLVSADPNIIVTHTLTPGVADTVLAARHGAANVIKGFVSGEDEIHVPLALLRELNPTTTLTAGPVSAERLAPLGGTDMFRYSEGVLSYCATGATDATAILTLDDAPAMSSTDMSIV